MLAILILTLPTRPNAVRLRVWRGLKALGCAALRDGAYLLPVAQAALFEPLADEVRAHGGTAMVLDLAPRSEAQRAELLALFDRSTDYRAWLDTAAALMAELQTDAQPLTHPTTHHPTHPTTHPPTQPPTQAMAGAKAKANRPIPRLDEAEARRRLRAVADSLAALQRMDHFPGAASAQAVLELAALQRAVQAHAQPGEPQARAAHGIALLDRRRFQGKRWATRARPWVDRLASAWLIQRFIDDQARFLWLADPARQPPPRGVLGFDYDGARFTHVGNRVTFEVLLAHFGLASDAGLQRIGAAVHFLDAGGIPVPEAAGLRGVLDGLRQLHADDDALLAAACTVFDALYAAPPASAAGDL